MPTTTILIEKTPAILGFIPILKTLTLSSLGQALRRSSSLMSPPRLMASCRNEAMSTGSAFRAFLIASTFCFRDSSSETEKCITLIRSPSASRSWDYGICSAMIGLRKPSWLSSEFGSYFIVVVIYRIRSR